MVDRFNALATQTDLDFEVWFTQKLESGREWSVSESEFSFRYRYLQSINVYGNVIGNPIVALNAVKPDILVSFHAHPQTALHLLQHTRRNSRLVYYVEKTFDTWVRRHRIKELAKYSLFHLADGFLTPGVDADEYVRKYAGSSANIYRLHHALNVDHFHQSSAMRTSRNASARRTELGLKGFVFLNVGRMIDLKGIPFLLQAFQVVQTSIPDSSLLLVGNGPDREKYQSMVRQSPITNVVFLDFVQQPELPEIYALGDAFVFPTLGDPYGIVIDEARAAHLPIVSTHSAGEIRSRVIEAHNGFLVEAENPSELANRMIRLAANPRLALQLGEEGFRSVEQQTTQRWIAEILAMRDAILGPSK